MTIRVGICQARTDFPRLIALVESGEDNVMVTRHGKPVAHIVPPLTHLETPSEALEVGSSSREMRKVPGCVDDGRCLRGRPPGRAVAAGS